MVFKSDRQRKGFFANRGTTKSNINPQIMKSTPKLPKNIRDFIGDKISLLSREGKPQNVAIGRAFSEARKKFGKDKVPKLDSRTNQISPRTRRLLFTILGVAIALRLLREFRTK